MGRQRVVILVCGALLTVLFVCVSTSDGVRIAQRSPTLPWDPMRDPSTAADRVQVPTPATDGVADADRSAGGGLDVPEIASSAIKVLLVALAIGLIAVAWSRRPRPRRRRPHDSGEEGDVADLAVLMATDAMAQRDALLRGEPRDSIVACWLRLEALVVAAGFEKDPADTSSEFARRVLSRFTLDPRSVDVLASLYREARFSTHEISNDQRQEALRLLNEIHAGVGTRAHWATS